MTELTTGLDLVKLQLHVAAGGRLEGEPPPTDGLRDRGPAQRRGSRSAASPRPRARSRRCRCPSGPGIRVDTGVAEGDVIPPEYDSMIAKVIAHGRDRDEALARLHRALSQMTVVVRRRHHEQVVPARPARPPRGARRRHRHLLARPPDRRRRAPADRATPTSPSSPPRSTPTSCSAAIDRAAFLGWASRGRPHADTDVGREIELRHGGQSYRRRGPPSSAPTRYDVELDGVAVAVDVERLGRGRSRLTFGGRDVRRRVVGRRAATTSSRSTVSPTASRATTPASSGPRRPRSWSASTSRPTTSSRPATGSVSSRR